MTDIVDGKIAIWGTEFDQFTVHQTTNEKRIRLQL